MPTKNFRVEGSTTAFLNQAEENSSVTSPKVAKVLWLDPLWSVEFRHNKTLKSASTLRDWMSLSPKKSSSRNERVEINTLRWTTQILSCSIWQHHSDRLLEGTKPYVGGSLRENMYNQLCKGKRGTFPFVGWAAPPFEMLRCGLSDFCDLAMPVFTPKFYSLSLCFIIISQ